MKNNAKSNSVITHKGIGRRKFQRRLGVSSATASKLIRGDGNVTLETIASVSLLIGVVPELSYTKYGQTKGQFIVLEKTHKIPVYNFLNREMSR